VDPRPRSVVIAIGLAVSIAALSTLRAQNASPDAAPKTVAEVDARYQSQLARLQRDFDWNVKQLRQERTKQLQALLDRAMEQKDADQVVAIRNLMQASPDVGAMSAGPPPPRGKVDTASALQRYLADSKWEWGADDMLVLSRNGIVQDANWQSRGLVTRWEAIDRRTVLMMIDKGRDDNRCAIMRFNETLTGYDAINFEGGAKQNNRRLK
jgi:hypothetical protein